MRGQHVRTPAQQMLLDLAEVWSWRYAAYVALQQRTAFDYQRTATLRPALTGVIESFTVLYLLAQLYRVDPGVADRAARWLTTEAHNAQPEQLVRGWVWALVETGELPQLPLAPPDRAA